MSIKSPKNFRLRRNAVVPPAPPSRRQGGALTARFARPWLLSHIGVWEKDFEIS